MSFPETIISSCIHKTPSFACKFKINTCFKLIEFYKLTRIGLAYTSSKFNFRILRKYHGSQSDECFI